MIEIQGNEAVMIKVSHSLIAVWAFWVRGPLILGTANERRSQISPFAALCFVDSENVPIYCWFDRDSFQSSDGEARVRSHDLPAQRLFTVTDSIWSFHCGALGINDKTEQIEKGHTFCA